MMFKRDLWESFQKFWKVSVNLVDGTYSYIYLYSHKSVETHVILEEMVQKALRKPCVLKCGNLVRKQI